MNNEELKMPEIMQTLSDVQVYILIYICQVCLSNIVVSDKLPSYLFGKKVTTLSSEIQEPTFLRWL